MTDHSLAALVTAAEQRAAETARDAVKVPPAPKPGDRIHYEGEVTVTGVGDNGGLSYAPDGHVGTLRYRVPPDAKVEVIAPAEPEYEVGQVYRSANGSIWVRVIHLGEAVWRDVLTGVLLHGRNFARPLSRLRSDAEWRATLPSRGQIIAAMQTVYIPEGPGSTVRWPLADAVLALLQPAARLAGPSSKEPT